jgi:hypothetical protein
MARTEARIKTSIWIDDVFLALEPDAKLVYMMLLSQPKLNNCGVMSYTPGSWANLTLLSREDLNLALKSLQGGNFMEVDECTDEVWIRTLAKNDGVLGKPYMVIAMSKDFGTIQSRVIREHFLDSLGPSFIRHATEAHPAAFEKGTFAPAFLEAFNERFAQ